MFKCSYEKLKTYKSCALRYKFLYIDLIGDKFKRAKGEFTMGQHVHATLRTLLAEFSQNERSPALAKQLLRKYWRTNRAGFKNTADEKEFGQKALAMMDSFFETNLSHTPYALEKYIKIEIGRDIEFTGRIDRIDVDSSGAAHIIDYKTNNYSPQWMDFSQLMIYSYLVKKGYDLPIVSATFWFLGQNQMITIFTKNHNIDAVEDEIKITVNRIKGDQKLLPKESPACLWCEFRSICPIMKHNP